MPKARLKDHHTGTGLTISTFRNRVVIELVNSKWGRRDYSFPAAKIRKLAQWILDNVQDE